MIKIGRSGNIMENYNYMMSADDIAKELNCSKSHAYKLVRAMNKELSAQGYITRGTNSIRKEKDC